MAWIFFFLTLLSVFVTEPADDFKSEQLRYPRVRTAYSTKEDEVKILLSAHNITLSEIEIFLRVFKSEEIVEIWAKNKTDELFQFLKAYDFCSTSGEIGPKRRQGDLQIPEGIYEIDRFNPASAFYLSLGINYPNPSDKILGAPDPGGDIFIHGACVTIGCIPITDDKIMELYLLAVEAKNNGQKISVHIFPDRLTEENLEKIAAERPEHQQFWNNLMPAYQYFDVYKKLPRLSIDRKGEYRIAE